MDKPKSIKRKDILNKIYKKTRKELKKYPYSSIPNVSIGSSSAAFISNFSCSSSISNDSHTTPVTSPSFILDRQMCLETDNSSSVSDSDNSINVTGSTEDDEFVCINNEANIQDNVENSHLSDDKALSLQLGEWAIRHNINHSALNSLLHILKHFHDELHLDACTLLKKHKKS